MKWIPIMNSRILRIVLAFLVALAVVLVGLNLFKMQIANVVFKRTVERLVGADPSLSLPDGLHIYLCGTGSPLPDPTREGPCIGILAGERAYMFDVGAGGVRNLGMMGFPLQRLDVTFLTHLHSDHIDGLGELLLMAWIRGNRDNPLPIYGPKGTQNVVSGFNDAYRIDSTYRTAHHGYEIANPRGFGGMATEIKIPKGPNGKSIVYEADDLKITAINVEHAPVEPAFGYRIDYKDRSVSISGDTIYHDGFVSASQGVDVMLHEALNTQMVKTIGEKLKDLGQENASKVFHDILDYHASPAEAATAAEKADAETLVLYHIVPAVPLKLMETLFLKGTKSRFDGKIIMGQDRMLISLPAGSEKVLVN